MNKEHLQLVIDKIEACPDQWKQNAWHCGSTHCIAGRSQILAGKPANAETVRRDAREFLDISRFDADYLFAGNRTLEDFKTYARYGYYRDGFARYGYARYGLDKNNKPRPT